MKRCHEFGHVTKTGEPCGFIVRDGETACQHHSEDKTRQREIMEKSLEQRRAAKLPNIATKDFATVDDCLRVRAEVVKILCKEQGADFRRLDLILKATTGASGDHATKATEEQNKLLLAISGHGAGVAMLQRLQDAPRRQLPGRRTVLDVSPILETDEMQEAEDGGNA